MGKILAIFTAPRAGAPMEAVRFAALIAGHGIAGDRYAEGTGTYSRADPPRVRHVTFIAREAIEAANRELSAPFAPIELRRNVLVEGIDLNACVGGYLGNERVLFRGAERAEPCLRPALLIKERWGEAHAPLVARAFKRAFAGRGGLRAEIAMDALIGVHDTLRQLSPEEAHKFFPGCA
jgi:MOSC domain-containing protein YiiM